MELYMFKAGNMIIRYTSALRGDYESEVTGTPLASHRCSSAHACWQGVDLTSPFRAHETALPAAATAPCAASSELGLSGSESLCRLTYISLFLLLTRPWQSLLHPVCMSRASSFFKDFTHKRQHAEFVFLCLAYFI